MECRDVRPLADAYLTEQLLVETTRAIVEHLERCPPCRAEFEGLRRIKLAVKGAVERSPSLQVRPEFRSAVAASVRASASTQSQSPWRSWITIAAGLFLTFGLGLAITSWLPDGTLAALAHLAAGDHQNCALAFKLAERPVTLEEGGRKFDPAFARLEAVDLPAALSQGRVRVAERHACIFNGQPFAHIVVIYKETPVSLLVADAGAGHWWQRAPEWTADSGFQIAGFHSAGHAVFVVSTLPKSDVEEIARSASAPIARALSGA